MTALMAVAPAGPCSAPVSGEREAWAEQDRRALLALVQAYPVGAAVRFGGYQPVLSSRWWRRWAAANGWGLRAGDALAVVGYGATQGVPEALRVRRVADGQGALVFPSELAPPVAPLGAEDGRAGLVHETVSPAPAAARSGPAC